MLLELLQREQRSKWLQPQRNQQEKDVVILIREDIITGIWPLGIIEKVFLDPDNVVRSVLVRTGGTECPNVSSLTFACLKPKAIKT